MLEKLRELQVLSAENIFLADPAPFGGEQMSARAILDADQVQSGVQIRRHPAIQKIDDHPAGRRRLVVHGPDRRRGITTITGAPSLAASSAIRSAINFDRL